MKKMNPLTTSEFNVLADAVLKLAREEDARLEAEKNEKLTSGAWVEVNGKLYDARYYKG